MAGMISVGKSQIHIATSWLAATLGYPQFLRELIRFGTSL
jgi:hypothetical protein